MQAAQEISAGIDLQRAFYNAKIFPPRVTQMVAVGEESGSLDKVTRQLGEYFEQRLDYIIHNINQLLEPAIMIVLSIIVGSLVIAMYLPIFRLGAVV